MKRFGRLLNLGVERGSKACSKASATGVVGQARRLVLRACLHRKWTGYIEIMILLKLGWSISWCRWDLSTAKKSLWDKETTKLAGLTHQAKLWLSQSSAQKWLSVLLAGEDQGNQLVADEQVIWETGLLLMVNTEAGAAHCPGMPVAISCHSHFLCLCPSIPTPKGQRAIVWLNDLTVEEDGCLNKLMEH